MYLYCLCTGVYHIQIPLLHVCEYEYMAAGATKKGKETEKIQMENENLILKCYKQNYASAPHKAK